MAEKDNSGNVFTVFDDSPRTKDPTIQVLYEYEKHYMELVRKYRGEIEFMEKMLNDYREENILFYKETLPEIEKQLNDNDGIDDEMKKLWLERLADNIQKSFMLTNTLINDFTLKKLNEFNAAVKEKIKNI